MQIEKIIIAGIVERNVDRVIKSTLNLLAGAKRMLSASILKYQGIVLSWLNLKGQSICPLEEVDLLISFNTLASLHAIKYLKQGGVAILTWSSYEPPEEFRTFLPPLNIKLLSDLLSRIKVKVIPLEIKDELTEDKMKASLLAILSSLLKINENSLRALSNEVVLNQDTSAIWNESLRIGKLLLKCS